LVAEQNNVSHKYETPIQELGSSHINANRPHGPPAYALDLTPADASPREVSSVADPSIISGTVHNSVRLPTPPKNQRSKDA
jgi:hypothetical protein